MKLRHLAVFVAILAVVCSLSRALVTSAQSAPDGTVVQGGVAQGPQRGAGGSGQFPFGRGAGSLPEPAFGTYSQPTAVPTPTPPVADSAATGDVFHPQQPFATAQCQDGWFSYSQTRDGTCVGHGGVMIWVVRPGDLDGVVNQRAQEAAANAGDLAAAFAVPTGDPVAGTATPSSTASTGGH